MPLLISMPHRALFAATLLCAGLMSSSAFAQGTTNSHIKLVEMHLADVKYTLPQGDYVLFTTQPSGTVSTVIVYDLTAGKLIYVPGTHAQEKIRTTTLAPEKVKLIRDVMSLESVRNLPRDSGVFGLDGSAFVGLIRLGNRTQQIGQWESDSPVVELLERIYHGERDAYQRLVMEADARR